MTEAAITKKMEEKGVNNGDGYYSVTADLLNVRTGPGTSYPVVATVKRGSTLLIKEQKDGWGKFSTGWVSMNYVRQEG